MGVAHRLAEFGASLACQTVVDSLFLSVRLCKLELQDLPDSELNSTLSTLAVAKQATDHQTNKHILKFSIIKYSTEGVKVR